jgi:hypothetical protein
VKPETIDVMIILLVNNLICVAIGYVAAQVMA